MNPDLVGSPCQRVNFHKRAVFESAGFRNVHILWEGTDPRTNMGNGILRRVQQGRAEGAWYAMVVGQK